MINNERFKIESEKLDRDYTICSLADLHNNSRASFELWDNLLCSVDGENPDLILISGDLTYNSDDFYVAKNDRMLRYLFCGLNEIADVFICLGNHDLKPGRKFKTIDSIEYLRGIEKSCGVHILDKRFNDEYVDYGNIRLAGFCPRTYAYFKSRQELWDKFFIEDYLESLLEFNQNQFNILLTHSPDTISNKKVLIELRDKLKDLDLILCGHKHDGYIPKFMQKFCPDDDIGIDISDGKNVFEYIISRTDKCRGEFDVLNAKMFVNRGYRKFSHNSLFFAFLDNISSRDISTISLKKKI